MRAGPDVTPCVARDQILEVGIERIPVRDRLVDPGIAQHLSALDHAVIPAFFIIHSSPRRRCNFTASANASPITLREAIQIPRAETGKFVDTSLHMAFAGVSAASRSLPLHR